MNAHNSIVRSVTRAHAITLLLSGLLAASVAGAASIKVLLNQDDAAVLALSRTLASEIEGHREQSWTELDELVKHEQEEQRWFHRDVEVWRDKTHRVGGPTAQGRLARFSKHADGCENDRVGGSWTRVCVSQVRHSPATVVIATPISAITLASLPIVLVVCAMSLLSTVLLALVSRWAILRALSPLERFKEELVTHDGSPKTRLSTLSWGAEEIDHLAMAFDGLLERVATTIDRERRFVANAAHELRTPLTRLRGQIELAAAELSDQGTTNSRLSLAIRSCEDLTRSTDSLLALSREEASTDEAVDLVEIASQLQRDTGVAVEAEQKVIVRGDRELIILAVRNLVDNALKYGERAVRMVVCKTNQRGELRVEDEGPGIPAEELQRVREPFVRGKKKNSEVRGTGLGLALVDHVANIHGGQLVLEARHPQGLVAKLIIPLFVDESTAS